MHRLLFPFILIIAAILLRNAALTVDPVYQQLLLRLPYITVGLAAALCVYFNRARAFTAACAMLVVYYLIHTYLQVPHAPAASHYIYTAVSVLLPATLAIMLILPERGLLNQYGLFTVAIVPLQIGVVVILFRMDPASTWLASQLSWIPAQSFTLYLLPLPASIIFVLAIVAGLIKLYKRDSEYDAVLVALMVTVLITFARYDLPMLPEIMFGAAGFILITGLLRSSHEMAYRDELTGLPGRRAFNEQLKGLGRQYVIAMLDVDHFKSFNDTYGHDVGDDVLKMVAQKIAAVQGGGTAYRYGGEEFSIVFPGKDIEDCKPCLEDVRRAVEDYRMLVRNRKQRPNSTRDARERRGRRGKERDGKTVSVTISIGVSAPKNRQITVDEVVKTADSALYKAKQNGRNCLATKF